MKYLITFAIIILFNINLSAWEDCPYDILDCTGLCGRFIDINEDGLCDHSQPQPGSEDSTYFDSSIHLNHESLQVEDSIIISKDSSTYDYSQTIEDSLGKDLVEVTEFDEPDKTSTWLLFKKSKYHLIPLSLMLTCLYFISWVLAKKSFISRSTHKKIWNLLLFVSFMVTSFTSVILIVQINFNLTVNLPFNLLFLHVESGIAMMIISIFHLTWHGGYIKKFLK